MDPKQFSQRKLSVDSINLRMFMSQSLMNIKKTNCKFAVLVHATVEFLSNKNAVKRLKHNQFGHDRLQL